MIEWRFDYCMHGAQQDITGIQVALIQRALVVCT